MKKILFSILCLCATQASAQSQTSSITGYLPYQANGKQIFLFQLQGNVAGACNTTGRFAIDSSSLHFKSVQAAIMAAFHSQSTVTVAYAQTCNTWGNAWDISYVCVGNLPC
jgi:hypothetical protein